MPTLPRGKMMSLCMFWSLWEERGCHRKDKAVAGTEHPMQDWCWRVTMFPLEKPRPDRCWQVRQAEVAPRPWVAQAEGGCPSHRCWQGSPALQ